MKEIINSKSSCVIGSHDKIIIAPDKIEIIFPKILKCIKKKKVNMSPFTCHVDHLLLLYICIYVMVACVLLSTCHLIFAKVICSK